MMDSDHISDLTVAAFEVPTDFPESDGTLKWDSTTIVTVEISAMGKNGLGFTYANAATALYLDKKLKQVVVGKHPFSIQAIFNDMLTAVRNDGQCGLAMMAISAVDIALWDLKAKLFNLPLCSLLGQLRQQAKVYGSGGFTSYTDAQLQEQLGNWAAEGFRAVKMKIGREPQRDLERVRKARGAIGEKTDLFIDANGAFSARQAVEQAALFQQYSVGWFEEAVSSQDLQGLQFVRQHTPPDMRIAAGEYGYTTDDFMRMLEHGSVDVLQADATRCGGITGFLKAGQLCNAYHMPFSFHCSPAAHLHPALCTDTFYIGEYFHDHVRIEKILFDGLPQVEKGFLVPDLSAPGLGLNFKMQDADPYRIS
ncbi:MAG TPA: enolase C-terminal domain-like protein [Mucilaginibacter sp.]|nr:enolase C-terminal domain-like protein [Mucilaginibacter sp.]